AGLYTATVSLFQRLFVAVTGDKSDAAIVLATLVLATTFTPIRKWLEGIVERRFPPDPTVALSTAAANATNSLAAEAGEGRAEVEAIATRVARREIEVAADRSTESTPAAPDAPA